MDTQNPNTSQIPKNAIVHGACGRWWTGTERSHCGGCHETFTGLTAFERHRKGLRCNPPAEVGLVARQKPYGTLWGQPAPEGGYSFLRAPQGDDEGAEA
ncbi:FDXHR family putative zinc-binding protein [Streptomyces wuyuanensis]|uniref:FDXHR family putative zinc-binding protein n=1 Tax=Streptomyces wuyuanensis TaxID=1196353 RepID=UPI00342462C5